MKIHIGECNEIGEKFNLEKCDSKKCKYYIKEKYCRKNKERDLDYCLNIMKGKRGISDKVRNEIIEYIIEKRLRNK